MRVSPTEIDEGIPLGTARDCNKNAFNGRLLTYMLGGLGVANDEAIRAARGAESQGAEKDNEQRRAATCFHGWRAF